MFETLENAGKILEPALDQYLEACIAVRDQQTQDPLFSHTQEHSAYMTNQVTTIANYEDKLRLARIYVNQSINHSPYVARIHSLPDETLGRIFHMTLNLQPCFPEPNDRCLKPGQRQVAFSQAPERLSHICSRWRRLAFGLPTLWQHVDINTSVATSLACANARMDKAGQSLIDIHMIGSAAPQWAESGELERWAASAAPRMRSLVVILLDNSTPDRIISAFFKHCIPGTFTHLTMWKDPTSIIQDSGFHKSYMDLTTYQDNSEIDAAYHGLVTLRFHMIELEMLYTDQVYPNLSELHLVAHRTPSMLHFDLLLPELVKALRSCPKLRIFRFDLKVEPLPMEQLPSPVHLPDLEVLDLSVEPRDGASRHVEFALTCITPGTRPLQLSINDLEPDEDLLLQDIVQSFFARSNVTKLKLGYNRSHFRGLRFDLLSSLAPQLRVLVLEQYRWLDNHDEPAPNFRIDRLELHHCDIIVDSCIKSLDTLRHPPQILTFWGCKFWQGEPEASVFQGVSQDVKILGEDAPNPLEDWVLDSMPNVY